MSLSSHSRELIIGAGALLTGFILGFGYLHSKLPRKGDTITSTSSSSTDDQKAATCPFSSTVPKKVFVLTVLLKLDPSKPDGVKQFFEKWRVLADYCKQNEPHTLSYEALQSRENPHTILIHERYVTESDLTVVHHSSQPFKDFGKWLAESGLVLEKTRATYDETNVGFMEH